MFDRISLVAHGDILETFVVNLRINELLRVFIMHQLGSEKVKIIVLGDSGVGKTSLVHLICHGTPIAKPSWTIGCSPEVKIHDYKAGTALEKAYCIELWDVGGWSAHVDARPVFYNQISGVIVVHDLTNRKSQQNLRKWLLEVVDKTSLSSSSSLLSVTSEEPSATQNGDFIRWDLPILVVGTKQDIAGLSDTFGSRTSLNLASDNVVDEINLDCISTKFLSPGTGHSVKLCKFFDKVIDKKLRGHDAPEKEQRSGSHNKSLYLHMD